MTFATPSVDDSFLRFSAIGTAMEVSTDGGIVWEPAQLQKEAENSPYAPIYNYMTANEPELWRPSIYRYVVRTTPDRFFTTLD